MKHQVAANGVECLVNLDGENESDRGNEGGKKPREGTWRIQFTLIKQWVTCKTLDMVQND